ncbi:MAG: YqaJ viral recombinase family protein [Plesiomonas shigelloides]
MFDHCTIIGNTDEMTREEWLAARTAGIGGSDVGAICGLNKWKTPFAVYMDKIGQGQPVEENEAMELGIELESTVTRLFTKRTGLQTIRHPYLLQSNEHPFMLANVDGLVVDGTGKVIAGLECKTALSLGGGSGWEDDGVPDSYMLQCIHYMAVTGLDTWYIAALTTGPHLLWRVIRWDDEIVQMVIGKEREFWNRVQNQDPPMVTGEDIDLVNALYPAGDKPQVIQLDSAAHAFAMQYNAASAAEKEAKAAKDEAKANLCMVMGDHSKAVAGDVKISWTPMTQTRIDTDRLKKERPDIVAEYSNTTASRRFSIK